MDTSYSLTSAVEEGRLERAIELIRTFDLSYSQAWSEAWYILLCIAIENEHTEVTKLILTSGSKVNSKNHILSNTPLHFAVINGDIEIVEMLLDKGAHINAKNQYGEIPLHTAIENKKMVQVTEYLLINKGEIAKLLLSRGANIDALNKWDETPVHVAAREGYLEIVKILLKFGADVDSRNKYGRTPVHVAVGKGYLEIVKVLLKFGADVDSRNKYGATPLHVAAQGGYLEIVEILLKFGADIDSKDEYGRTALHYASHIEHEKIVVALLEYGSDINITSKSNQTPLDVAYVPFSYVRISYKIYNNQRCDYYESDDDDYELWHDCNCSCVLPDVPSVSPCDVIAKIFKQQIIKMKTANLYVSRTNLLSICSNCRSDFQNKCEEEMESMKNEKMSNNHVTFHDILTKNINQLAIYARNENIVQVLKSDDYKTKFPIYASMINSRFRKGVERKELLEQGNRFFHSLFNRLPELPYYCTEKIFSYLSDKDLRVLIDVCEDINIPNTDISDVASTLIVKGRHIQ